MRAILSIAVLVMAAAAPAAAQQRLVAADGSIELNRFYSADETNAMLREWARLYPELARVYSIGRSFLGAELLVMEVTNLRTGPAADKPALYVDGGIHAGELTGSAVATHFLAHLLRGYGTDERVTRLLDTQAFYVRPKFNPDGADAALLRDQSLRSSVRPIDDDDDGAADEDPAEDLDGDGRILQMRIRDAAGDWTVDPRDARIMIRRTPEHSGPFYRVLSEGIDNDGDGRFNEDGLGSIDMNRNFPRNWEPEFLQPGAGPFPLSEPETHATLRFLADRPNIIGIFHGHTSGGFVYRLPSAVDPARFDSIDLKLIVHLGEEYTRSTGRPVRPSSTHATNHRYGTLLSWAYWDRGIIGWVPEFVPPNSWITDYDGDGTITAQEAHRFNDEVLGGRYFKNWTPFQHPQLGAVEIGGWHAKFWGQNPPREFLEQETVQQLHWMLYLAEQAPRLVLEAPTVTALGDGRYRVDATIRNDGYYGTHLTRRGHTGRALRDGLADQLQRPPEVRLELIGGTLVEGDAHFRIPHLAGSESYTGLVAEREHTVSWTVRPSGAGETVVRVHVASDTGGRHRSQPVPIR